MIVRDVCEGYFKTPRELDTLTLDEIWLMGCDRKLLGNKRPGRMRTERISTNDKRVPREKIIAGSLASQIRARAEAEAEAERKSHKRRKRG